MIDGVEYLREINCNVGFRWFIMLKKYRFNIIFYSLLLILLFGFMFYLKVNNVTLSLSNILLLLVFSLPFLMFLLLFTRLIDCFFSIFDESNLKGIETYGIVCGLKETDGSFFGGHFYSAQVYLEISPYKYKVFEGSIGLNKSNVIIGDILKVNLDDNVITILEKVEDTSLVSENLLLNYEYEFSEIINKDISPDVVVIDGIKYRKKVEK